MIEKRHPQLDRRGHSHLVGFDQQVIGQAHLGVKVQHLIERRCVKGAAPQWGEILDDGLHRPWPKHPIDQLVRERPTHAKVTTLEWPACEADILAHFWMWHGKREDRQCRVH